MSSGRLASVVLALVVLTCSLRATGVEGPSLATADEQALKSAHINVTPVSLLDFFRKRTPADVSEKTLSDLMKLFNDRAPEVHNKAFGELVGYGSAAVPSLRRAANELDDTAAAERARRCLEMIQGSEGNAVIGAAIRGVAIFKPEGAAEVLLNYYPFADDDALAEEVTQALIVVAVRDGKPEPALLQALEAKAASKRTCAAMILCQTSSAEHRSTIRKLLKDPVTTVRLRAALALAQSQDAEAIPVLIDLLAELPLDQTQPIEEYMSRLAGEWSVTVPSGTDEVSRRLRREIWTAWWKSMDGAYLLAQLKKQSPSDAEREKIQRLVAQMNDVSSTKRGLAMVELLALGEVAVPSLRKAAASPNTPNRERIKELLKLTGKGDQSPLPPAAVRLIALRKPEGATEALLIYLPSAEDANMDAEVHTALASLATRDGKPDPALIRALADKLAVRRGAAAEALCRTGLEEVIPAVRKLTDDADPGVRLRAALALINAKDRHSINSLIGMLPKLPLDEGNRADSFLRGLAGDKAPNIGLTAEAGSGEQCRDAWLTWWRENGHTIDLAKSQGIPRLLGYTLVVEQYSQLRRGGRVWEMGTNGKMRWEITGLQGPIDAKVVGNDRVLITEQSVARVSERDMKGNMIWQKQINLPQAVQRLPNGNTFIAARGQLLEIDRNQKEVFNYPRPNNDIMTAQKFPDGQIAYLTYGWNYVRLDAKGKEVKNFRIGPFSFATNSFQILPGDRVLVPDMNTNRVLEINADGKKLWEVSVPMPSGVQRLPNGNTLVSSVNGQRIVEVNQAGKVVWEHKEAFNPWKASRR